VTLEGQSAESTVLTQTSTGINLIDITDASKIPKVVRNLTLTGDADSGHGIFFNNASYCSIENCKINAHGGYGLYFDNFSHYSQIVNCYIQENVAGGVYMTKANFNTFLNCKFDLNLNYAVNIQVTTVDISFKHCSFEAQPQMAVNLNGVNNILFETCWFENNTTASGDEDILITGCQLVTFRDNRLGPGANSLQIIHLVNSREVRIEENRLFGGGESALRCDSDCGRNYFISNYVDHMKIDDRSYHLVVKDIRLHTASRYLCFPASESMSYYKSTLDLPAIKNLCPHSSFENAHNLIAGGTTPPALSWEKNDGWYDKYSAKITFPAGCDTGHAGSNGHRVITNITAGKYYIATFRLKASVSTYRLEVEISGASGIAFLTIEEPPTDEFIKFVMICRSSTVTGIERLYVNTQDSPVADFDVWLEDIQFFEFDNWEDMTRIANFATTNYLPQIDVSPSRQPAVSEADATFNYAFEERAAIADVLEILGDVRGLWTFRAPYHTVVKDYSRRDHDMTPSEDCRNWDTAPRYKGKATIFTFNGSDEGMSVASHADFQFGNAAGNDDSPFSVICIVRPAADTYPYTLIGKYNEDTPAKEWVFRLNASKYPEFELYDQSANEYIGRRHAVAVTEDDLMIFIVTYDGSETSAGVKIYKNGLQVDNANHQSAGAYVGMEQLAAKVTIGYNVVAGPLDGNFLKGGASWFGITGKELSADEVWSVTQRLWGLLGM